MEQLNNVDIKQMAMFSVLLGAVYYFLLFDNGSKIMAQIAAKNSEISLKKDTLEKTKRAIDDKLKFDQEVEEINTNITAFLQYFPDDMDVNGFMKKISKAAEENAATVLSLRPVNKNPEFPDYPEMAFEFEVEGLYNDIMGFLSDLTQLKRALDFSKMELAVASREENPRIKFSSTLVVFGHKPAGARQ